MARRSLWPREHGAYVQLLAPLITALVIARPTTGSVLFAIAAVLSFAGSEPLRVAVGARGLRARSDLGARAVQRLGMFAAGSALAGVAACVAAPRALPIALAVGAAAVIASIAISKRRSGIAGELAAAIALAGAGAPVMAASGIDRCAVLELWLAWSIGFAGTTFAVHCVIGRGTSDLRRTATIGALIGTTVGVAIGAHLAPAFAIAGPLLLASAAIIASGRPQLRTVGVTLAVVSATSGILAIATI